jgi:integrase
MSLKGTQTTTSYIDWNDFKSLVSKLERDKEYKFCLLISIGVLTGLRISDLLRLKYSDILGKDILQLKEQKTGNMRSIKINNDLLELVDRIKVKIGVKDETTFMFLNRFGTKPIDKSYVNVKLKSIFRKYRIRVDGNVSSHLFRKTLGREVMERNNYSNEHLILLSELFGHSSLQITKRYLGIRRDEIHNIYDSVSLK